jgi:hypothetical protein
MREIPTEQVIERIRTENPWWSDGTVPEPFRDWRPRPYLRSFAPYLTKTDVQRALVLMGPRRVGKTVMIHHAIDGLLAEGITPESVLYVSVDHPIYTGLGLEKILRLAESASGYSFTKASSHVFFDEIQYLRNWEVHLKVLVDDFRRMRCVASGSAAAALRLKSDESEAGRFSDFLLPPLTFHASVSLTNALRGHQHVRSGSREEGNSASIRRRIPRSPPPQVASVSSSGVSSRRN